MHQLVFGTHFYVWDNKIFNQQGGAPMGLRSSCPISRLMMDFWASAVKEVEERLQYMNIINPVQYEALKTHLLRKYVDDVLTVLDKLKKGVRWFHITKTLLWSPEHQKEDEGKNEEELTMEVFKNIASSILQCLDFTYDCPSLNSSKKMPVLDTQMWMDFPQRQWGVPKAVLWEEGTELPIKTGALKKIILYEFYRKPMSNRTSMLERSAMPNKDQIQTCVNEYMRRFKNTSRELPEEQMEEVIKEYSNDLKRGGFSKNWIKEALKSSMVGYGRMVRDEIKGIGKINRPEHMGRVARRHKQLLGKGSWFQKAGNSNKEEGRTGKNVKKRKSNPPGRNQKPETVLFIPHTPNGELKQLLQQVDSEVMGENPFGRVKLVERLGDNITKSLSNRAPWKSEHCGRDKCLPCATKTGSCRARNVTYGITCLNCQETGKTSIYWGESHRTWGDRAREHVHALETGDLKYGIVKHHTTHHNNATPKFKFKLHKSWKTSLQRQIAESLLIQETPIEHLINSKSEWGNYSIPRLTVEKETERAQQESNMPTDDRDRDRPDGDRAHKRMRTECATERTVAPQRQQPVSK